MRLKSTLVGIFLLACFNFAFSQDEEIQFSLVTGDNGEPLGKITGITQDPQGYMWFSGQDQKCLYRYDGVRMISYRHDNLDDNSLGGYNPETVYADQNGIIWVGFGDAGLDQFDPLTRKFIHHRNDLNDPSSLSDNCVNVILKDSRGRLWVGTNQGLDLLDEATGKFIHHKNEPGNSKSLSDNTVRAIYEDRQGVIWVGTGYPWFKVNPESGGLNRLEADGSFTRFVHDPKDQHSLINNKVRSIFEDSRGVFWVGTSGDGLHTMDRKTGRFQRHQYDPAKPEKLSRPPRKKEDWFNYNDQVTFITEDRLGFVWIGSMWTGLNRYDPTTNTIKHFEANNGFPGSSGWMAYQSRDGVMWLTTQENNLHRINFPEKKINSIELGSSAHRFLEEKNGILWVGTEYGLLQLDHNRKVLDRFSLDPDNAANPLNNITSLFQNQEDTIWIGTHDGFGVFDKKAKKFSRFPLGSHFKDGSIGRVITIIQDHLGSMWFATQKGLMRYDPKDGFIKWYRADKKPGSIRSNDIIVIEEDKEGILWVGTANGGVNRFNRETEQFTYYLGHSKETCVFIGTDGTHWAGTPTGLYRYDERDGNFSLFGEGSIISKDGIFGIIEDRSRNLWVATPSAITKIAERTETFTYGRQLGINNYLSPGAIYLASNGEILVGHGSGFYTFHPEEFGNDSQPFKILITDLLINNLPLKTDSGSNIVQLNTVEEVSKIRLEHNRNNLSFKYAAVDYRAPEATTYFSKLEGYDDVWREAAADRASYFFNVPPGEYVYRVKAYNAFGSKTEKSVAILITPPWWKTWWAYAFYGFCGLGVLSMARREIVRRERLRATFKLEHLELAKAKEVDKIKSAFFTNISHEFRTPLTLIKGHANDLLEEYASHPKTRDRLKMIKQNSDLLLKLINQLMDLARLESGGLTVTKTECDLNHFLSVLANSFSSLAVQKNIEMSVKLPSNRYLAFLDKDKLETILTNLISNAIKFSPSGGRVNLAAMTSAKDNDSDGEAMLSILVKDSGIGIPHDLQAKVFDRFFQVSESHKEFGTGIGLALVKELTEMMGGNITLTSEPGNGSEFQLTLPITIIRTLNDAEVLTQPSIPESESINGFSVAQEVNHNGQKPKLLVVEDNADLIKFITSSLGSDYDFLEATDGRQGLETALNEIPELIISDVMMPEMDGITMTEKLKNDIRTSHVPIILLTAKVSEESKLLGLTTGADDYLTKPFNKNELILKVRNAIASRVKIREKLRLELLSETPKLEAISADEQFLVKVKNTILTRLADEQLSVDTLAEEIGFSRAQFYRKVTALTGLPVNELIKRVRLQKAAELLAQQWGPVSQVAYEVGFSNPSYFSKCFKDQFGVLPSEYSLKDPVH